MRTTLFLFVAPIAAVVACGQSSGDSGASTATASTSASSASAASSSSSAASTGAGGSGGNDAGAGGAPTTAQIIAAEWAVLPSAPKINGKQDDLYFLDAMNGYSVNGTGQIFNTSDGGATWTELLKQAGTYFRAITFADAMNGFAGNIGTDYYPGVTDENPLYRTTDGGKTWSVATVGGATPKGICGFYNLDGKNLVANGRVGGPSFFLKSSDGGATWSSTDISSKIAMLVDSYFSTPQEGFLTGGSATTASSHCVILHTTDGGATWNSAFTSKGSGEMCWKMSFPSPKVGYAAVLTFGNTPSTFIKTSDGGATWQELPFVSGSYAALGVGFVTEDIGWIGGEASKPVYKTTDGGMTWQPDKGLGPYINRFRFVGERTGYAIGSTIYKWSVQP